MQTENASNGDVKFIRCVDVFPEGLTAFPTTYNLETRKKITGYLTPQELSKFAESQPSATGAAAHTPIAEVTRVVALLPKPEVAFVDYGCGYDARWCVAAAERWPTVKVFGVELDPARARAARTRVRELGLNNVTIIEGDATTVDVSADVGVVYLYPDVLTRLRPRLERLRAFASYMHQVPGLPTTKNGDTWLYTRQVVQAARPSAVWNGVTYYAPPNGNCNCQMCQSIRGQLAANQHAAAKGYWKAQTQHVSVPIYCNGRICRYENRYVTSNVWVVTP